MRILRRDWATRFPRFQGVAEKVGYLPVSSTFYAGYSDALLRHFYLNFQCSSKPWHRGVFTINIYGTKTAGVILYHHRFDLKEEGAVRIGHLVAGGDKWWALEKQDRMPPMGEHDWIAEVYGKEEAVFDEALADVNDAVEKFLGIACPSDSVTKS